MVGHNDPIATVRRPWLVLGSMSIGLAGLVAGQLAVSPLLPTIIEDFQISATVAGGALTAMWATAALCMYPGGRYSDVLTRTSVLLIALLIGVLGFLLVTIAPTFALFVLGLAIVGVAVGLYEPTSMAAVPDLFETHRGRAFGVISAAFSVGSALAAGLGAFALFVGNWRVAFIPAAVVLAVTATAIHISTGGPYALGRVSLSPRVTIRRVLKTQRLRVLLGLFCLYMFLWQGAVSFFPTLLQTELGRTPTEANLAFGSIFVIGLLVSPIVGDLGDRVGYLRIGTASPVIGAVGLSVMLLAPTQLGVALGTIALAIGMVSFWPVMTADLMAAISAERMGGDYGIVRAVFFGVGSLGPVYVGTVADLMSYRLAYAGIVGCFLLAVILFRVLDRA